MIMYFYFKICDIPRKYILFDLYCNCQFVKLNFINNLKFFYQVDSTRVVYSHRGSIASSADFEYPDINNIMLNSFYNIIHWFLI